MAKAAEQRKIIIAAAAVFVIIAVYFKDEIYNGVKNAMDKLSLTDFVRKYKPYAVATASKYGVPWQVTIAQAILESNFGKSAPGFNFFGIKDTAAIPGKQTLKTQEYNSKTGQMETKYLDFEVFSSPEDAFNKHAELLKRVYSFAFQYNGDPYKFAEQLTIKSYPKYATDPNYYTKIKNLISQINGVN